ncbi:MAG: 3'-5' exonuclease [Treponemataceae bacterium]|nr:3'-5' exonuclease [Treponemataceae bacterium]
MKFLWIDTETTGLEPADSGIFELGAILVENGNVICERCFFLNPLSDVIKYHEDSGAIHGYSENQIREFTPESEQVVNIADFFREARNFNQPEKMIIAGYNVSFDIKHLKAMLGRYGYRLEDYFSDVVADVFLQVKKAGMQKALPYLPNRKLETVATHLGVILKNAHDALADIKATREVAIKLRTLGVPLL